MFLIAYLAILGTCIVISVFYDFQNAVKLQNTVLDYFYFAALLALLTFAMALYFFSDQKSLIERKRYIVIMAIIICMTLAMCFFAGIINMYCRPIFLAPLLGIMLLNKRSAIIVNFFACFVMLLTDYFNAGFVPETCIFFFVGIITGTVSIYLTGGQRYRARVFLNAIIMAVPTLLIIMLFGLNLNRVFSEVGYLMLYGLIAVGFSVFIFFISLPVFEVLFKIITDYRLMELTSHHDPLIKRLRLEAPGTFNHSLNTATLAEACAVEIDENPLLARAGAYYHDIGKLRNPQYFVENQEGAANPHDELSPELSTQIIARHTQDGIELAKRHSIPKPIADVIASHHGTSLIKFFYAKALKLTEGELNAANFSYHGPKPRTKIAAIVMICDTCEAVGRLIGSKDYDELSKAIGGIILDKLDDGQFSECPITLKELETIKQTIILNLTGIYHKRIAYPKFKKEASGDKK